MLEDIRAKANEAQSLATGTIEIFNVARDNLNEMKRISRGMKGAVESQSLSLYEARLENMIREVDTLVGMMQTADESFQQYVDRFTA